MEDRPRVRVRHFVKKVCSGGRVYYYLAVNLKFNQIRIQKTICRLDEEHARNLRNWWPIILQLDRVQNWAKTVNLIEILLFALLAAKEPRFSS